MKVKRREGGPSDSTGALVGLLVVAEHLRSRGELPHDNVDDRWPWCAGGSVDRAR
jgi:hypothetical protein